MRAEGLRSREVQKTTFKARRSQKEVVRGASQMTSREVLKEVVKGDPQEIAKGDVSRGRLKRRSQENVVQQCREKGHERSSR